MSGGNHITISAGDLAVTGALMMPESSVGFVIIGCCDDRLAAALGKCGLGTLQLGLDRDADVATVAARLIAALDAITVERIHGDLPIGLFCAGTCSAAALIAGAQRIDAVSSIVCVGGLPELAGSWLQVLRTPTLLIVGSRDTPVLRANRDAARAMVARHRVTAISGATHLFAEPGARDEVTGVAAAWFVANAAATTSRARAMQFSVA
jgi:putative phosphoribosyl transferase